MPAALELVEVPEVGEAGLDPTARRPEDLLREDRAPRWNRDRFGVGLVEALPVEPGRRCAVRRAANRASRCRAARRARARSRDGRRSRSSPRTSRPPTRTGTRASRRARSRASVAGTPAGWSIRIPTARSTPSTRATPVPCSVRSVIIDASERYERQVDVDPHDVLGVLLADARRDEGAPVTALRAVAVVAEARHQLRPRAAIRSTFHPGDDGLSLNP